MCDRRMLYTLSPWYARKPRLQKRSRANLQFRKRKGTNSMYLRLCTFKFRSLEPENANSSSFLRVLSLGEGVAAAAPISPSDPSRNQSTSSGEKRPLRSASALPPSFFVRSTSSSFLPSLRNCQFCSTLDPERTRQTRSSVRSLDLVPYFRHPPLPRMQMMPISQIPSSQARLCVFCLFCSAHPQT